MTENSALLRILEIEGETFRHPQRSDCVQWGGITDDTAVVLGPSAILALVNFTLDGVLEVTNARSWPFPAGFALIDTRHSPYAPQHYDKDDPRPVGTAHADIIEGGTFMLLQRSERWQRPLNALYNVSRRNLALDHSVFLEPPRLAVVLDTLVAESEPTLAASLGCDLVYRDAWRLLLGQRAGCRNLRNAARFRCDSRRRFSAATSLRVRSD
jgi:hypothetical protein